MKKQTKLFTAWFLVVLPSVLLGQSTQNFQVSTSFEPDRSEPVQVTLTCNGGLPLEQSFELTEEKSVTFTVLEFSPDYSCTLHQASVKGFDTAYAANGETSDDACTFSGDNLLGNNSCVITNTWLGNYMTLFEVGMDFTDDNPMDVEVAVTCNGTTSVTAIDDNLVSESSPAIFEVMWPATESASCTVTQVAVPTGYFKSERNCLDVPMTTDPAPQCTIENYQRSVPVRVGARFLDGDPSPIQVELTCDAGTVAVYDDLASNEDKAKFRVRNFPYTGTSCSASAVLPDGYEVADSTCSDIAIKPEATIACEFINVPVTPVIPDSTAITGSWYSPDSSGEGFMLHSVNENLAVGYFYGYDNEGERLWLIGISEGPFEWGVPAVFEAQYATGGSFNEFTPANVARVDWGTFVFTQWECDRATIEMLGEHGDKTVHVTRLASTSGTKCSDAETHVATDAVTGSWYDEATSGQGFSVHKIAADRGVVYFYGFDDTGKNLWLTGVWENEWLFGDEIAIEMLQASGGTFSEVDSKLILREFWGTLQLGFDDCDNGWARLEGIDGIQEFDLTLLAGSLGLGCASAPD
jgi:hypothetical protein